LPPGTKGVIPVALIVAILQALTIVLQGCQPTPAGGAAWLKEPTGWFGLPRRRWEARIRRAVADKWDGPPAGLPDLQTAVLARIRAGVYPGLIGRLYAEAGIR
jgi:hypothetical protein